MTNGTVKWFNDKKGFGFIEQENGKDIFVHHSEINVNGFKSLREGDKVVFETREGRKGLTAVSVRLLTEYENEKSAKILAEKERAIKMEIEIAKNNRKGDAFRLMHLKQVESADIPEEDRIKLVERLVRSESQTGTQYLCKYGDNWAEREIGIIQYNLTEDKKAREDWINRTPVSHPGEKPEDIPVFSSYSNIIITRKVIFEETESWEGDDMRNDDNIRSCTHYNEYDIIIDEWKNIEKIFRDYLTVISKYCGNTHISIEEDIKHLREKYEYNSTIVEVEQSYYEYGYGKLSRKISNNYPNKCLKLFDIYNEEVYLHAKDIYSERVNIWKTKVRQYYLSNLEEKGGRIRLYDGVPYAPIYTDDEPITSKVIFNGNWNVTSRLWGELADWEDIENYHEDMGSS